MLELNIPNKSFFLLAVSGGLDSMTLLYLFNKNKINFEVAHINYGLRGNDSEKDQKLVEDFCNKNNIKIHIKKVNFADFKTSRNSLQMVARKIRYDFFNQILDTKNDSILVTAHHLNDKIETFFINLLRGSGLKGLASIKSNNQVYRPFLNYSKQEIENFAKSNSIIWNEDYSNKKTDYIRNKIRINLIPELKQINENYENQINKSIEYINQSDKFIKDKINKKFLKISKTKKKYENIIFIKLEKLKKLDDFYLFNIFDKFNFININELKKFINSPLNTTFTNDSFIFWIDYKHLIIQPKHQNNFLEIELKNKEFNIDFPFKLKSETSDNINNSALAYFDLDKLNFPLKIRNVNKDDIFNPLNMNGSKKVFKYLKDKKISNFYKQYIYVLVDCNNQIIWVINHREDDKFKVEKSTHNFLNIFSKY